MENFAVIYVYPYKGFFEKRALKLEGIDEKGLAYAMADFLRFREATMIFSGVDEKGIKEYIKSIKGESLYETISRIKAKEVEEFSNDKELKDVAITYSIFRALREHGEDPFPSLKEVEKLNPAFIKKDFPEKKGIGVMVKLNDLVIIKKMSYEDAKDYMVAGIVSSISDSFSKKIYPLLGKEEVKKKKKSLKNLAESFKEIKGEGIERNYNIYKAIIESGFTTHATIEQLSKKYKDLKPKKPKGRLPK